MKGKIQLIRSDLKCAPDSRFIALDWRGLRDNAYYALAAAVRQGVYLDEFVSKFSTAQTLPEVIQALKISSAAEWKLQFRSWDGVSTTMEPGRPTAENLSTLMWYKDRKLHLQDCREIPQKTAWLSTEGDHAPLPGLHYQYTLTFDDQKSCRYLQLLGDLKSQQPLAWKLQALKQSGRAFFLSVQAFELEQGQAPRVARTGGVPNKVCFDQHGFKSTLSGVVPAVSLAFAESAMMEALSSDATLGASDWCRAVEGASFIGRPAKKPPAPRR